MNDFKKVYFNNFPFDHKFSPEIQKIENSKLTNNYSESSNCSNNSEKSINNINMEKTGNPIGLVILALLSIFITKRKK